MDWLSAVETHCLLVMQQVVLSTADNIYRSFTICSDLLLHLTSFPKLYSHQKKLKKYKKYVSYFLLLFYHSLFCISTPFPRIFVNPLYLGSCVYPAVLPRVLCKICSIFPGIRLFRELHSLLSCGL